MDSILLHHLKNSRDKLIEELAVMQFYQPVHKDILIVVKDQLEYVQACVESIQEHTQDFTLYIWDNASRSPTANYLQQLDVVYHREDENLGFIIPNNRLAELGKSPFVILLNSDTIVQENWDRAMIAWLQSHPDTAVVGYGGGKLKKTFQGKEAAYGESSDYVCGWSMALARKTIEEFGLFDEENLKFAYGEDSDLCYRLRAGGKTHYVLHLALVQHFGHRTIRCLTNDGFKPPFFDANHAYLRERWQNPPAEVY